MPNEKVASVVAKIKKQGSSVERDELKKELARMIVNGEITKPEAVQVLNFFDIEAGVKRAQDGQPDVEAIGKELDRAQEQYEKELEKSIGETEDFESKDENFDGKRLSNTQCTADPSIQVTLERNICQDFEKIEKCVRDFCSFYPSTRKVVLTETEASISKVSFEVGDRVVCPKGWHGTVQAVKPNRVMVEWDHDGTRSEIDPAKLKRESSKNDDDYIEVDGRVFRMEGNTFGEKIRNIRDKLMSVFGANRTSEIINGMVHDKRASSFQGVRLHGLKLEAGKRYGVLVKDFDGVKTAGVLASVESYKDGSVAVVVDLGNTRLSVPGSFVLKASVICGYYIGTDGTCVRNCPEEGVLAGGPCAYTEIEQPLCACYTEVRE